MPGVNTVLVNESAIHVSLLVENFGHVPLGTRAVYALDDTVSRLPSWRYTASPSRLH
jgi:hypothetical protein